MTFWTVFWPALAAGAIVTATTLMVSAFCFWMAVRAKKRLVERAVKCALAAGGAALGAPQYQVADPGGPSPGLDTGPAPQPASPGLAPCPFCGSHEQDMERWVPPPGTPGVPSFFISCASCFACGPMKGTPEGAEDAWNASARMRSIDRS